VRLIDVRGASGTVLTSNIFRGGRYQVRSTRSRWTAQSSRFEAGVLAVFGEESDTITLASDTARAGMGAGCAELRGVNARLVVQGGLFDQCASPTAAVGGAALVVNGVGSTLVLTDATVSGPNQTAVLTVGRDVTIRRAVFSGAGTATVASLGARGAADLTSDNSIVVASTIITDFDAAGLVINGRTIRVDSNVVARNRVGVRILDLRSWTSVENDIADNDSLGVTNVSGRSMSMAGNWWGDGRGPRRGSVPAATGDSITGPVSFDAVRPAPLEPGNVSSSVRQVRGSGQAAPAGAPLARAFTTRVVDDEGRPVAGVAVTFTVTDGGGNIGGAVAVTVLSDASGLAEATLTLGASPGHNAATASIAGGAAVTFSASGT
jgi:hypothetical protein